MELRPGEKIGPGEEIGMQESLIIAVATIGSVLSRVSRIMYGAERRTLQ